MPGTNDSNNGIRSDTLENYKTLSLISQLNKTLCFSFEASRAVTLQQIPADLNCDCFKGPTFFYTPCIMSLGFVFSLVVSLFTGSFVLMGGLLL